MRHLLYSMIRFVAINPEDLNLRFVQESGGAYKASFSIMNTHPKVENIAFKVKTTAPQQFTVKPNQGVIGHQ